MRNSLDELPVLLCMFRGGLIAGTIAALLRLPRRLYADSLKGRRAKLPPLILLIAADLTAAAAITLISAASLIHANGGEPRAFAVCGFALGCLVPPAAIKLLRLRK